ncbi:MAG: hypothetical protein M3Z23_08205 [Acidobacteriota bacterium]|nr:hypothetical protein [Acidobacteriota bacterium]
MIDQRGSKSAYDMPTHGPRSPLLLTAVIFWLIFLVSVVTAQFIAK